MTLTKINNVYMTETSVHEIHQISQHTNFTLIVQTDNLNMQIKHTFTSSVG